MHEIFVVPINDARYRLNPPRDIELIDDIYFYLFLETEKQRKFEPMWYNFNLITEGHILQIWVPSKKIRILFSSQGKRITQDDIIENDPTLRLWMTFQIINYDVTTSEKMNEEEVGENDNHQGWQIHYDEDM